MWLIDPIVRTVCASNEQFVEASRTVQQEWYLWCELVHASDCMGSRGIQQGVARVVLQTGKRPQHI